MALITRTVVGTKVTAKVVSKTTDEVKSYSTVVSKVVADEKAAARELAKVIPSDLVIITVVSFEKVEKLYGITPAAFMENAVELDPATRKPLEKTETEAPVEE